MIELKLCKDIETLTDLYLSNDIYPYVADDISSSKESWEPNLDASTWLVVLQDDEIVGTIWLEHRSQHMVEVHFGFLKTFKRKNWNEVGETFFGIIREHFPYRKLIGQIPEYNRPALLIANKFGFEREGELKDSVLKDGQRYKLIIVGRTL